MIKIILVFLATALVDALWAKYIFYVSKSHPWSSSIYGSAIYCLNAYVIVAYVEDTTMIIPAAIGGFVGTFLTIKYQNKKAK